jgi:hypothetical protein
MIVKVLSERFMNESAMTDERCLMAICLVPEMRPGYPLWAKNR